RLETAAGEKMLTLGGGPGGSNPQLYMYGEDRVHPSLALGLMEDGSSFVSLIDESGADRLTLMLDEKKEVVLSFHGKDGELRTKLGEIGHGQYGLALYDKAGDPRAGLGMRPNGEAEMSLYGKKNGTRLRLSVSGDDTTDINFTDMQNRERIRFEARK